ncbi:hypothetical protein RO3G_05325 [Rhizopus delemar RA 99-880]|uniref:Tc1-like transposase DDE domain-containing protein n=1 Tax=Rhizopus delemar (strain RA 99-880 / ATCC MYA-4621 / FGSC 9543 / NRRL 43880) TaxID=246409 RepID=I1BWP0_RHIO9|nr:hypothetical protein RO3G_05325 [Rhizopus delemar RA 99-880]|eukprot:EIE80620.1 hypothetical protein RO3G_05325 [Rhizopus delemar RA 99-880]
MFTSLSYSKVGEKYGIPVSTLKSWVKAAKEASKKEEALEVDDAIEEQPKKNQHLRKLEKEHTKFLEEFIDNNSVVTLDRMVDALSDKFEGLSISKSGVDKHLKESCSYTLKRITKIPAKRNSPDVIELRFRAVEAWIKDSNISFMQNCIFIDEAGFNLHTVRSQGRSKKGEPAKVVVATTRGPSVSILGAICSLGVINVGLKVTKAGTKWKEFMAFLIHVMDVLDKHNLKGCNLAMDNAPIHKPEKITEEVSKRGYRIIYLPPYSPFLNPIEEFWAKVKTLVRRSPMTDRDNLVARIREAAEQVTHEDCQGWIRHAESFFERCLNKEELL